MWKRRPSSLQLVAGPFWKPDWYESGIVWDFRRLFNLGCRQPTQTKHRWLCQECKIGLHLRQSLEGQGEEWGQLGNWRNEMVCQTGHRKNLKNAKISNPSNESQNSLKSKPGRHSGQPAGWALSRGCSTAKLYGWDHPASHSQDRLQALRGIHKDKSNKDLWGRFEKHSRDDPAQSHNCFNLDLLNQGSADPKAVVKAV